MTDKKNSFFFFFFPTPPPETNMSASSSSSSLSSKIPSSSNTASDVPPKLNPTLARDISVEEEDVGVLQHLFRGVEVPGGDVHLLTNLPEKTKAMAGATTIASRDIQICVIGNLRGRLSIFKEQAPFFLRNLGDGTEPSCTKLLFLVGDWLMGDSLEEEQAVIHFLQQLVTELNMFTKIVLFSQNAARNSRWAGLTRLEKIERLNEGLSETKIDCAPVGSHVMGGKMKIFWAPLGCVDLLDAQHHDLVILDTCPFSIRDVGCISDSNFFNGEKAATFDKNMRRTLVHHGNEDVLRHLLKWLSKPINTPQAILCAGPDGSFGCTHILSKKACLEQAALSKPNGSETADIQEDWKMPTTTSEWERDYNIPKLSARVYNVTPFSKEGTRTPYVIHFHQAAAVGSTTAPAAPATSAFTTSSKKSAIGAKKIDGNSSSSANNK